MTLWNVNHNPASFKTNIILIWCARLTPPMSRCCQLCCDVQFWFEKLRVERILFSFISKLYVKAIHQIGQCKTHTIKTNLTLCVYGYRCVITRALLKITFLSHYIAWERENFTQHTTRKRYWERTFSFISSFFFAFHHPPNLSRRYSAFLSNGVVWKSIRHGRWSISLGGVAVFMFSDWDAKRQRRSINFYHCDIPHIYPNNM